MRWMLMLSRMGFSAFREKETERRARLKWKNDKGAVLTSKLG